MSPEDHEVDPVLLTRARQVLGTSGRRETLERALALAIQQGNRDQAVQAELVRFSRGRYARLAGEQP